MFGWLDGNGYKLLIIEHATNRAAGLLLGAPDLKAWHADCNCHLCLATTKHLEKKGLGWGFTFIGKVLT